MSISQNVYPSRLVAVTVPITIGLQLSEKIACKGASPVGIIMPSAFTGTALTFLASYVGDIGTFSTIYNSSLGSDLSISVAVSRYIPLDPTTFAGVQFFQLQSNAVEAATRSLTVILGPTWQ